MLLTRDTIIAAFVGAFVIWFWTRLVRFIRSRLSLRSINWKKVGEGWAVVTGATDGIGKEFVRQLHARGIRIILIGRNHAKLDAVIAEMGPKKSSADLIPVELDLAHGSDTDWKKALAEISRRPVSLLVNCAGLSHEHPKWFQDELVETNADLLAVNCAGPIRLTQALLPGMLDRRFGIIWNIGSMSAELKSPMLAVYAASKSFLRTFSEALAQEVASSGVTVELLNTYFVATKMSKKKRTSWTVVSPTSYVSAVLSGVSGGFRTPVLSHAFTQEILTLLPASFLSFFQLKLMKATRAAALKRKLQ